MSKEEFQGRTELRKASRKRLLDAQAILTKGREHAHCARYLAGYAVECKLKAIAMETFGCWTLKELAEEWDVDERVVFTHGLESIAKRLPLYERFKNGPVWRDFTGPVNEWRPSWRYNPETIEVEKAKAFLEAVKRVLDWLDANRG